jgi:hypothetical protein
MLAAFMSGASRFGMRRLAAAFPRRGLPRRPSAGQAPPEQSATEVAHSKAGYARDDLSSGADA